MHANKTVRHNTSSTRLKSEMSQLAKQMQKLKPRRPKGVTAATERMEKATVQQARAERHLIKYDAQAAKGGADS